MTTAKLLIVGATGPTGREVLKEASLGGISVRSLARTPSALDGVTGAGEVVQGDVLDPSSLVKASQGVDAIICVLGARAGFGVTTLVSTGTANLIEAAKTNSVKRLVVVTGMGAGDSRGHGGWLYDRILLPLLLRQLYADKDRQEALITDSGLDWTIVRPAFLTNGPRTTTFRALDKLQPDTLLTKISRADVAQYLVRATQDTGAVHRVIHLTN